MTAPPDLVATLRILFDLHDIETLASSIYEALGNIKSVYLFNDLSRKTDDAIVVTLDRRWFDDRMEAEERVFTGTHEQFVKEVQCFAGSFDFGEVLNEMMDQFISHLIDEQLVIDEGELEEPTADEEEQPTG